MCIDQLICIDKSNKKREGQLPSFLLCFLILKRFVEYKRKLSINSISNGGLLSTADFKPIKLFEGNELIGARCSRFVLIAVDSNALFYTEFGFCFVLL